MDRKRYTDESLIQMIKEGGERENKAIGFILQRNKRKISSLVIKGQGTVEDAEDVLQEGIVELIFTIVHNRYKPESSLDSFLYRICKFIWYKKYNKKIRELSFKNEFTKTKEDSPNTPEVIFIHEELKELLRELALYLGEDCFQVLYLSALNYSSKEIVKKMPGFNSPQAIMNKKSKCKKKLGELIETNEELQKYLKELKSFYYKGN